MQEKLFTFHFFFRHSKKITQSKTYFHKIYVDVHFLPDYFYCLIEERHFVEMRRAIESFFHVSKSVLIKKKSIFS